MPRFSRGTFSRRRPKYRRRPTKKRYVSKAVKSYVARSISTNTEHKFFDLPVGAAATTTSMVFSHLTNIPQGDGDSTRDGDALLVKSFDFKLYAVGSSNVPVNWRVVILKWKPSSTQDAITAAQVFQNTSAGGLGIMSPFNHDFRKQFTVLFDKWFVTVPNSNDAIPMHFYKIFKAYKIQYEAASANGQNKLMFGIGTDIITGAPSYNLYSRVNYTDG